MDMPYAFFRVPLDARETGADELNQFVRSHRVVSSTREWVASGANSFWAFCIEFTDSSGPGQRQTSRIDYREVLPPEQFEIFAQRFDILGNELGINDFRISDFGSATDSFRSSNPVFITQSGDYSVVGVREDADSPGGPEQDVVAYNFRTVEVETTGTNGQRVVAVPLLSPLGQGL